MRVSTRHTLFAGAGAAAIIALSSVAWAGGSGGSQGCNTCQTSKPKPPSYGGHKKSPCCQGGKGHGLIVPGVNVAGPNIVIGGTNVNVNGGQLNVSAQSYLNVTAGASASSDVVAYAGGGGGFGGPAPVGVTSIDKLNVSGALESYTETVTENVPTTEEYCVDEVSYRASFRAVQAVCIDDKGAPHPASQVDGGRDISAGYSGEVFRCLAGTRLQVTLGEIVEGRANFDHGQTMACAKGEALIHNPGGKLVCAPQAPQRDCNERSLLRRYGPGIKVIEAKVAEKVCVPQTRTVMKQVTHEVEKVRETAGGSMIFDGGVGQGVY
jgi:hypothetical protein